MPRSRIHGLKRPKIRQDWAKENLYNLSRLTLPPAANKSFFQQKWRAKSITRAFHNPYVREGQWTRMFDRRLPSVAPMSHEYLAKYDGSEMAAGRGSGVDRPPSGPDGGPAQKEMGQVRKLQKTPYMHMTFGPLERRLDTAIWRALFASSVRQARQFVVHGWVTVNGKKMKYPGYQLNPGDMFAVDPERVMYATGARKRSKKDPNSAQHAREQSEEDRRMARSRAKQESTDEDNHDITEAEATAPLEHDGDVDPRQAFKQLVLRAERILEDSRRVLSGKRLQELREFSRTVKRTMSKLRPKEETEVPNTATDTTLEGLEKMFAEILVKIPEGTNTTKSADVAESTVVTNSGEEEQRLAQKQAREQAHVLHRALQRAQTNPVDVSKPYATPWRPRDFMAAFAFIPRYLEVNQNICTAVYLRHPVARPGLAEVPTPFHGETMALAFNWYLRRR